MAILKCKMCGGDMKISADKTFGICEYCGSMMTLPKIDDDARAAAFNRGNHFRRTGEFDNALQVYEKIVEEDPSDAEAHWCCALCRFGIEWVEDPATMEYLPTCHRVSFDPFTEDVDCKAAVDLSEGITKRQYQKDAARIAEVQKGILAASQNEKPFDVFICYKENDNNGQRTVDSTLAQDIYYQLTEEGLRVFFARITLEDKVGSEYEPYIFAALNSAKVMVVVGTKPEHFNAVWVKNEWSRFLSIVKRDRKKVILPCYRDMDPYDLPEQLSILQSYDMSKIGFMQDLIRGIKKVTAAGETRATVKETVVQTSTANTAPLLKRAFIFLEDGNWKEADDYCEKVLDQDPENAQAYIGKLMAELHVRRQEDLLNCEQPFDGSNNFQKAVRFGGDKLSEELNGYIKYINDRNENDRLTGIYNGAVRAMSNAKAETNFKAVAGVFKSIAGFKDADALAEQCLDKAEGCRKDAIYASGKSQMTGNAVSGYEAAISTFRKISGWRDADEQIYACQRKIDEIKAKEEADRLEAERRAQERRIAAKKRKRTAAIVVPIIVACIAFIIVLTAVIIPNSKYKSALSFYNSGKYDEAIEAFKSLGGYKDSAERISQCKYEKAIFLAEGGKYVEAYKIWISLNGYKNSESKANEIRLKYISEKLKTAKVGEYIVFGAYEQDNNTSNGKEDIEWLVLAKEGNKLLVISRYALDCKPYNRTYTDVTWETCSLRTWLNGTFVNNAFSSDEEKMIPTTTVTQDKKPSYSTSPGSNTTDKVFLLSITEVNKYFSSDSARQCEETVYCYAQGAYKASNGNCWWWLRSSSCRSFSFAAFVLDDGPVYDDGNEVYRSSLAVRPALWIDLGS